MSATRVRQTEERRTREAASGAAGKGAFVKAMFSSIAPRYDLLNHLLSFNVDRRWRREAIRVLGWEGAPAGTYLDLCAGTMDVAAELARQRGFVGRVIGADFAEPMLRAGRRKIALLRVNGIASDALALPLAPESCDGAIVAFGVRNLADLDAGLLEVRRVLKPGAKFVILEFSTPSAPIVRRAYQFYFHQILPRIGALVSGNRTAYRYLPESVAHFPNENELAERMRRAGFRHVSWQSLTFGIAAIHVGIAA
jgi:demethylmenaquinone methyltransferase/2-methoxy-6-polyprenyl-1,4-benzoquinol methylase